MKLFIIILSTLVSINTAVFAQGKTYIATDVFADSYPPPQNSVWENAKIGDIFLFSCPLSMASEGVYASTPSSFDAFIMTENGPNKIDIEIRGDNAITAKLIPYFIKKGNGKWVKDELDQSLNFRYFYPIKLPNIKAYEDAELPGSIVYIMDMYLRY